MNKNYLLLKEITLGDVGTIHSPIIEQLFEMTEEEYNKILTPFILRIEDLKIDEKVLEANNIKLRRECTIFDYLFNDVGMRQEIIDSLVFFYKTKEVCLCENGYLIHYDVRDNQIYSKANSIIISVKNWNGLCDLIKDLMCISNEKKERKVTVEHEENNAILQEYLRLLKQKEEDNKKLAEKNSVTLHDIVTVVASESNWDYDKVLKMTYYRLINSYKTIMSKDNYIANMMYHTSEKFDTSNMKIEHWTDSIRKGE